MVGARVTPLLLVLLLGSQQLPPPGAVAAPQLALAPCTLNGIPGPMRCGTFPVWEDREAKAGRRIELSIIVLSALKTPRPDPFVMIQGGPGDAPSFNAEFYSRAFGVVRQTRDIVLIDLRGTGKSAALTCPELSRPDADGMFDADMLSLPAVRACRQRLSTDHDLRFYTTEIAVDDLEEVRQALAYGPINIYGTSYGTRVAQIYMRRHPQSLRAVVMKGIVPPSMAAPESHAPVGETAWQSLVARCARDPACAHHFPTIDADFRQLLSRLEKAAPLLAVPGSPGRAATGVRVTRGLFAEAFRSVLYTPDGSAQAPQLVRQLLGGDERMLAERALAARLLFGGERLAAGFFLSVSCAEDIPFVPADADARAEAAFGGTYRLDQQRAACRDWPRGSVSPSHRQPTTSAVPALLLSGALDPVTPASGGDEVVRGLANGRHVVIRNNGHPIGNAERCIEQMIGDFLDRGSPANIDVSCAAAIPAVPFQLGNANPLPPTTPAHGAFAFSNPAGTEFIVLHDVLNPERLRSAICSGDVKPVVFARQQKGAGADRHWPDQFASLSGSVFRVVDGGANAGDACVLAPESLLTGAQVVRTQNPGEHAPCTAAEQVRVQSLRERRVQTCWALGTFQPRGWIAAVEWARQDTDALASIIINFDGRALAIDLPATFTRAGEDLWRVDDGGKFGGDGITIPFLIRRGGVFTIPMRWNGAESVSLSLFVSDETGDRTRQVLSDNWYRAPR